MNFTDPIPTTRRRGRSASSGSQIAGPSNTGMTVLKPRKRGLFEQIATEHAKRFFLLLYFYHNLFPSRSAHQSYGSVHLYHAYVFF
jgi:hypothetical protein